MSELHSQKPEDTTAQKTD